MRILITGSRGFIGGSVGRYAVSLGHEVVGTGRGAQVGEGWPGPYVQSDLSSTHVTHILREFHPDVLFHAAGPASVSASLTDPMADLEATAGTTSNILEGVRKSGYKPLVVIASSAAVFGNPEQLPINEDASVQPISPYGFHKAIGELLAREYAECFGLDIILCRFFSVFGAAQRRLLVWELYKQLAGPGKTVWLEGTGSESRDFLHVDDAATAVCGLVNARNLTESNQCTIVNIGRGIETRVIVLAEQVRDLVAPNKEIRCRGVVRKNDPLRWCADISRLRSLLPSWQPRPLNERLALCVNTWGQQAAAFQHGS
jgi:UDP-glucose 4-epimerase